MTICGQKWRPIFCSVEFELSTLKFVSKCGNLHVIFFENITSPKVLEASLKTFLQVDFVGLLAKYLFGVDFWLVWDLYRVHLGFIWSSFGGSLTGLYLRRKLSFCLFKFFVYSF